jgi:phage repressor protein C with HTH and peptisase S24 domain
MRRLGIRPFRKSRTKLGSPTASRPKALADVRVRLRKRSMDFRKASAVSILPIYRTIPTNASGKFLFAPSQEISYNEPMDEMRSLVLDRATELGISLAELSRLVDKNHAYFQQFIHRGVPAYLPEEIRSRVSEILQLDESLLRNPKSQVPASAEKHTPRIPNNARISGTVPLAGTIPVYGQARGGKDGQFVLNGNKVADIIAPPHLASVPNAFAVYIVGDSMEPRYFAGEAVFVNPGLPVRKGDFVIVQIKPEHEGDPPDAYVKRFVSMDNRMLRLEQYKPKKSLNFSALDVISVHRIIMAGEG